MDPINPITLVTASVNRLHSEMLYILMYMTVLMKDQPVDLLITVTASGKGESLK